MRPVDAGSPGGSPRSPYQKVTALAHTRTRSDSGMSLGAHTHEVGVADGGTSSVGYPDSEL